MPHVTTETPRMPVSVLTDLDVLRKAAKALRKAERLRQEMRETDNELRALCRLYDAAVGTRGFAPHHLAQACKARGLPV